MLLDSPTSRSITMAPVTLTACPLVAALLGVITALALIGEEERVKEEGGLAVVTAVAAAAIDPEPILLPPPPPTSTAEGRRVRGWTCASCGCCGSVATSEGTAVAPATAAEAVAGVMVEAGAAVAEVGAWGRMRLMPYL